MTSERKHILKNIKITQNVLTKEKKYNKEFIYNYKLINKEQSVSFELSNIFDKINEMFKSSTQYLESKKKINYNQNNHNKWEFKSTDEKSVINVISSNLNKITFLNYEHILNEIKTQEIILYNDLDIITEKIISKCLNETDFLNLYVKLITDIIYNLKWIVDDKNMIPITFRRILLNYLESYFTKLINDIKNINSKNDNDYIIDYKIKKNLILLITKLYINKIIGNQLIRYVFKNLENAYNENKKEQYLEFWLIILNGIIEIWNTNEKQYLNEQIEYIIDKRDKISLRIKFMIDNEINFLKKINNNDDSNNNNNNNDNNDDYNDDNDDNDNDDNQEIKNIYNDNNYEILILSSDEYENYESWFNDINNDILDKDKFLSAILLFTYYKKNFIDIIKGILEFFIKIKYYTRNDINLKIEQIIIDNDLSEYVYYQKHLDEYIKI